MRLQNGKVGLAVMSIKRVGVKRVSVSTSFGVLTCRKEIKWTLGTVG